MALDILERQIHAMRPGIDRDGVRVRCPDLAGWLEHRSIEPERGEYAGFGGDVQPSPGWIPREHIRIVRDREVLNWLHCPQIEHDQRSVPFAGDERQPVRLVDRESVRLRVFSANEIQMVEVYPSGTEPTGTVGDRMSGTCSAVGLIHPTYFVLWLKDAK